MHRRKLDERRQRALTRYYLAAGARRGGRNTAQFAIRNPRGTGRCSRAAKTVAESRVVRASCGWRASSGKTAQAVREARLAADLGYHAGLLSLGAMKGPSDAQLVAHARAVADVIPVFGFYLQPAVGGRVLSAAFWRRFAQIENVVAIKIAPFDRYATLEVMRAVAESGRSGDIALYTGNDDHILLDLLMSYRFGRRTVRMVGGLLGHWAFWTRMAVGQHAHCRRVALSGGAIPQSPLRRAMEVTDANAAIFDAANGFAGCLPGIHEILRKQGLLAGTWCLDPRETLSPGQLAQIDRVRRAYPHLNDDKFVARNLDDWLR